MVMMKAVTMLYRNTKARGEALQEYPKTMTEKTSVGAPAAAVWVVVVVVMAGLMLVLVSGRIWR
jgi:hypothetical protein